MTSMTKKADTNFENSGHCSTFSACLFALYREHSVGIWFERAGWDDHCLTNLHLMTSDYPYLYAKLCRTGRLTGFCTQWAYNLFILCCSRSNHLSSIEFVNLPKLCV